MASRAADTAAHAAASVTEPQAMARAVALAARGADSTHPNPVVGCVVLDPFGVVVGEGWHERPGGPHAEVMALAAAGERAVGGTAVVTLEPCAHTGRTAPCTQALLDAKIGRVVVAVRDTNPPAAGGVERLRAEGVDVEVGVGAADAEAVNVVWLTAVRRRRPYVTWKSAASLDGRSAAADGSSRWITGPAARADVHRLRGTVDAIAVGVGTVLADDPALTVRRDGHGSPDARQPLRVVVDSAGRTPATARVRDDAARTYVATAAELGAGPDGRVDLPALLAELYRRDVVHLLLEGGPRLAGAFLAARLVDRVVGYVAPVLLGAGPAALSDAGIGSIDAALRLEVTDVTRLGDDIRLIGTPRYPNRTGEER